MVGSQQMGGGVRAGVSPGFKGCRQLSSLLTWSKSQGNHNGYGFFSPLERRINADGRVGITELARSVGHNLASVTFGDGISERGP